MKTKSAIIDAIGLDRDTMEELRKDTFFYAVENGLVKSVDFSGSKGATHNSICTHIFASYGGKAPDYNISLPAKDGIKYSIADLVTALDFCGENDVSVVGLSLGTKKLHDVPILKDAVERLARKNLLIIASASNDENIAFPAAFSTCVGVRHTQNIAPENNEYFFYDSPFDGINVTMPYILPNSYGTPCNSYITAYFAGFVFRHLCCKKANSNKFKMDWIRSHAKCVDFFADSNTPRKAYLPVSAIIIHVGIKEADLHTYVDTLCAIINEDGYDCVVLSTIRNTVPEERIFHIEKSDVSKKTIRVEDTIQKICVLCCPDVLLVETDHELCYDNCTVDFLIAETEGEVLPQRPTPPILSSGKHTPMNAWHECKRRCIS